MAVALKEIIITLILAFGLNIILLAWANQSGTIDCPSMSTVYSLQNETYENHTREYGYSDILDMALGQCSGINPILIIIFQLPLLVAIFYIIRLFIGFT